MITVAKKWCTKCSRDLPASSFSKDSRSKTGLQSACKGCNKAYYQKNRSRVTARVSDYQRTPQGKAMLKRSRNRNRTSLSRRKRAYYYENRAAILEKQRLDPRKRARNSAYRARHGDRINANRRKRYRESPAYRLRRLVSSSVYKALSRAGGSKHGDSVMRHLPYTVEELVVHIEGQFGPGMTWANYGKMWEVDHIVPQVLFQYTSMQDEEFLRCWSLDNLRPLSCKENQQKGDRILSEVA